MKRSTQIGLAAGSYLLVASAVSLRPRDEEAVVYEDPAACRAAGELTQDECAQRFEEARSVHVQDARKFATGPECEAEYGPGRCETRDWNGAAVVVPALAGVMLARASLRDGGRALPLLPPTRQTCPPGSPNEECRPRDAIHSGSGGGGAVGAVGGGRSQSGSRAYTTPSGQAVVATDGRARASVVSRGGFGATGHGFGAAS